jgi:thiosulfate sulfurtransferase
MKITIAELNSLFASKSPVFLLDVRRSQARLAAAAQLPGATWQDPAVWLDWKDQVAAQTQGTAVVVYCAHGHEIGQGLTAALAAMNVNARYLQGGFSAWQESGGATEPLR